MVDQTLNVNITGDTSGLTKATATAARELEGLQHEMQALDKETIDITPEMELTRINRDTAHLQSVLRGLENRKVSPDVDLDMVQLLRDEKKVNAAIAELDGRRATIEADLQVNESTTRNFSNVTRGISDLRDMSKGGIPGLGSIANAFRGIGAAGTEAGAGGAAAAGGIAATATAATGGAAIIAAAAVAYGAIAYQSGMAAAEIETLQSQLNALTGGQGTETLEFLQSWAKKTPFELGDATEATKKLVAAGVDLDQIPQYLDQIGNVASATGVPLAQIATVFAQMESKGRPAYEEIQQLAEAGIPVWQTLADSMGLSVAEVQKLATEGKLTADAVGLIRQELSAKYPNAMADQADTLNGKISSLQDTFRQTWQELGQNFLPALKVGADALQEFGDLVSDLTRIWGAAFQFITNNDFTKPFVAGLKGVKDSLGLTTKGVDWFADKVTGADDDATTLGSDTEQAMFDADQALQEAAATAADLQKAFESAADALGEIGAETRVKVSFIIDKAAAKREIEEAIKGSKDEAGVTLPVHLKVGDLGKLTEGQSGLVENISALAEEGLAEGARRAKVVPGFDSEAWYAKVRSETAGLLIKAGIDTTDIDRVLTNIFGLPRSQKVDYAFDDYTAAANAAGMGKPISQPIVPFIQNDTTAGGPLHSLIFGPDASATPKSAPIKPTVPAADVATANTALANVAQPGGDDRTAHIDINIDPISLTSAILTLAALTAPETKTITVNTVRGTTARGTGGAGGGGPATQSVTGAGAGLLGRAVAALTGPAAAPYFAPGAGTANQTSSGDGNSNSSRQDTGSHTVLSPRITPVKVFIDGSEVASTIQTRYARASLQASAARRTA
jgi:tape measure domain-containing protein